MPSKVVRDLSVAANAKSANQMTDFSDEYLRTDSKIDFYGRVATAGVNVSLMVGERLLIDDQPLNAQAGAFIDTSTDQIGSDVGGAGEKVTMTFRNTTAGALVTQALLVVTPV